MQRRIYRIGAGLSLALMIVLAGCHGRSQAQASPPGVVTPGQMDQAIASVNNSPTLNPQQKSETINMLRSHLKVVPPAGGTR